MKKWVKLLDARKTLVLDGHRIRYKKHVLGYLKSAWHRGLWLVERPGDSRVEPWIAPEGKSLLDVACDLEVEVGGGG